MSNTVVKQPNDDCWSSVRCSQRAILPTHGRSQSFFSHCAPRFHNLRASKMPRESAKVCRYLQFESYSATPVEVASHLQCDWLFNGVKDDTPARCDRLRARQPQDVTTYNS